MGLLDRAAATRADVPRRRSRRCSSSAAPDGRDVDLRLAGRAGRRSSPAGSPGCDDRTVTACADDLAVTTRGRGCQARPVAAQRIDDFAAATGLDRGDRSADPAGTRDAGFRVRRRP